MTWDEYEKWLDEPEQRALLPNRHIDKLREHHHYGPKRDLTHGSKDELKHFVGGNFEVGKKIPWYADQAQEVFGLPPELAFMHEMVQPEGQDIPDIELPYGPCDYDMGICQIKEYVPSEECRIERYLKQSQPLEGDVKFLAGVFLKVA